MKTLSDVVRNEMPADQQQLIANPVAAKLGLPPTVQVGCDYIALEHVQGNLAQVSGVGSFLATTIGAGVQWGVWWLFPQSIPVVLSRSSLLRQSLHTVGQ
jgi:hypothetical protein